ncbi:MAG: hypothetical protein M3Y05_06090 [Gemmatimonadota bacterium]|nr:hypothetical protein [Gemmatimonadota bacterium]
MKDDLDQPPRAYTTADVASQPEPKKRMGWRGKIVLWFVTLIIVVVLGFSAWAWSTLHYAYSTGNRAGFVQKFAQKGWLCKTWEGQIAMANLPGTTPEMFDFSVRSDSIAKLITQSMGQRVDITYEQHSGVPTSCFGETQYFVTGIRASPQ